MKAADFQAQYAKKSKVEQQPTEKPSALPRASTEPKTASASMDEQRECFIADLLERLYPMGDASHISDNVVLFTRGKHEYLVTIELKKQ